MQLSLQTLDRIWRSQFARNVVLVASGTAGAQAINIAFAPLITRIYEPEAFGLLGTFTAIVVATLPLAAFAYPIAIVLPRDDRDAMALVRLSIILSLVAALLVAAALWVGGNWFAATLGVQAVAGYLFLVPLAMVFAAWMDAAQQWLIRKKAYGVIARSAVSYSLILNSAKSGIGWLHPAGAVLIVLSTFGYALQAGLLFIGARRWPPPISIEREKGAATSLGALAYRYRDFPLYRAPQKFINAASQSLPVLILASFFGPAAAGFYTLSTMVMGMPSALLGQAVTNVFYPRITEAAHNGESLPRHIIRATRAMFAIGLLPFGIVMLFGPWLFSFVFGSQWGESGEYARWLAFFYLFNFINKPCIAAAPVLGIQRGLLIYELFSTGMKILALVVGFYWLESGLWAVALFSIFGVITYATMMFWIYSHAKHWHSHAKSSR